MKVSLELAKRVPCDLPRRFFDHVAKEAIRKSGLDIPDDTVVSLSVAFVSLDEIAELNRLYRRKNRPTDVLSFGNFRKRSDIAPDAALDLFLGELVLSPEFIAAAAKEDQVALEQEMAYIFSHGVFHLLGFRHCPRIFRMQDEIAAPYSKTK